MTQTKGKIKIALSTVVVALILAFFIPAAIFPEQTRAVCSAMYSFITRQLAWLMFACFIAVLAGAVYLAFSKHGFVWAEETPNRNSPILSTSP